MNENQRIGKAVASFRGGLPQTLIAEEMRRRGFHWSQATVWSVEKGERPLRLVEAAELAGLFNIPVDAFLGEAKPTLNPLAVSVLLSEVEESVANMRSQLEATK